MKKYAILQNRLTIQSTEIIIYRYCKYNLLAVPLQPHFDNNEENIQDEEQEEFTSYMEEIPSLARTRHVCFHVGILHLRYHSKPPFTLF